MKIKFSPKCYKTLAKIKQKDQSLFHKIQKQLSLFHTSPQHPSLRLHKLSGSQDETWSIAVNISYRLLFYYQKSSATTVAVLFACGKHEDVYQ